MAIPALCAAASSAGSEHPRIPVLLELFTSEGCSSCPPADRLLQSFDQKQPVPGAQLIVLSEHVDYWNYLGWRDPWSSAANSERQKQYNAGLVDNVYTPQLVVDGTFKVVGSDAHEAALAVGKAILAPKIPLTISGVSRQGGTVAATVGWPAQHDVKGPAMLIVALAEEAAESHVSRGENSGRMLTHVAVGRVLKSLGSADPGKEMTREFWLTLPDGAAGFRVIAFLQDPRTGRVLGVAQQKL